MALFQCPECKREISDKAKHCPHCGYVLEKEQAVPPSVPPNEATPSVTPSVTPDAIDLSFTHR
jgi:predicted amidophosphoribosyltransferase